MNQASGIKDAINQRPCAKSAGYEGNPSLRSGYFRLGLVTLPQAAGYWGENNFRNKRYTCLIHDSCFLIRGNGFAALTAVILITMISVIMIAGLSAAAVREIQITRSFVQSLKSYYIAEAGVEDAVYRHVAGKQIASGEMLASGTATATVAITGSGFEKTITSEAVDREKYYRTVESSIRIQGAAVGFGYGVQVGEGGLIMGQDSKIYGNVYSNGDIIGGGASKSVITGTAKSAGNHIIKDIRVNNGAYGGSFDNCVIDGTAFYVSQFSANCTASSTAVLTSPVASSLFPISPLQIDAWENDAAGGGTVGNISVSSNSSLTLGPKKVSGNITLGNSARLTLSGTVWVTGTINFGNSNIVELASGYGHNSGVLIVGGPVGLGNNAIIRGSGPIHSYLLFISLHNGDDAIAIGNNASSSVFYAPNGIIDIGNNLDLVEAAGYGLKIGNNASVRYEQGLLDINFTSGPAANWTVKTWKEVE